MNRRIGMISEHASPLATLGGVDAGGQNVYVGELARALGALGYGVDLFTRWDDARLPQIVEWSKNVRVIHIKAGPVAYVRKEELLPAMPEFTRALIAFLRKQKTSYKLMHANFFMSALVAADVKAALGIPFVVTFHALGKVRLLHQGQSDQFPPERLAIEQRVVLEADQIIAECPQDREDLIEHYGADPDTITVIPCGVNTQQFHPTDRLLARMLLNLDPEERLILQLGRMVPRKGVDNAIAALADLIERCRMPARLLIVGGESDEPDPVQTPEIGRLITLAEELGVRDAVTFVGRRGRDVLKLYYAAADVFVTTPWYEPFGMTPLEAMACGTPVIGSRVGGIQYSVAEGKTGFLVPPRDPSALADRLFELLSRPKLAAQFRQNAVQRVEDHFTWSKVASSMSMLYERVLAQQPDADAFHEAKFVAVDLAFNAAVETIRKSTQQLRVPVVEAAGVMTAALASGRKLLICGNGGSATQAQHFAAEFVGRFESETRPALPVIALTADIAILTAVGNDYGYARVFARQVEAYGKPGDVLIGISTSGNSPNVIEAFRTAREQGVYTIALLGKSGGEALDYADSVILVPSHDTQRIQEMHIQILHILCELVEKHWTAQTPIAVLPKPNGKILQVTS